MAKKYINKFSIQLLENYTTAFSEKMGITPKDWKPTIGSYSSNVMDIDNNRRYIETNDYAHVMKYEDDCIKLYLTDFAESANCVELQRIEIKERCKGRGTQIMNLLLDTADELGIQIRVLPVDYDNSYMTENQQKDIDYLKWLREWYKSFGFISYDWQCPALMYYPNK